MTNVLQFKPKSTPEPSQYSVYDIVHAALIAGFVFSDPDKSQALLDIAQEAIRSKTLYPTISAELQQYIGEFDAVRLETGKDWYRVLIEKVFRA